MIAASLRRCSDAVMPWRSGAAGRSCRTRRRRRPGSAGRWRSPGRPAQVGLRRCPSGTGARRRPFPGDRGQRDLPRQQPDLGARAGRSRPAARADQSRRAGAHGGRLLVGVDAGQRGQEVQLVRGEAAAGRVGRARSARPCGRSRSRPGSPRRSSNRVPIGVAQLGRTPIHRLAETITWMPKPRPRAARSVIGLAPAARTPGAAWPSRRRRGTRRRTRGPSALSVNSDAALRGTWRPSRCRWRRRTVRARPAGSPASATIAPAARSGSRRVA